LPAGGRFTENGKGTWRVLPGTSERVGVGEQYTFRYTVEIENGIDTRDLLGGVLARLGFRYRHRTANVRDGDRAFRPRPGHLRGPKPAAPKAPQIDTAQLKLFPGPTLRLLRVRRACT
ncbi:DUF3152 domain-containing protein, partial [Nocardia carnea]|uniref:DUF3152 domain-containing protein n=1 Tax=Nocardia carnea TaxID=37328 RepID=UPI0024567BFC